MELYHIERKGSTNEKIAAGHDDIVCCLVLPGGFHKRTTGDSGNDYFATGGCDGNAYVYSKNAVCMLRLEGEHAVIRHVDKGKRHAVKLGRGKQGMTKGINAMCVGIFRHRCCQRHTHLQVLCTAGQDGKVVMWSTYFPTWKVSEPPPSTPSTHR